MSATEVVPDNAVTVKGDGWVYDDSLPSAPSQASALALAEQSKGASEVQAALVMAKRFPRDVNVAFARIMRDCQRYSLASLSTYSYPKGGQVVSGPSIRLAEAMARAYGNLSFGVKEVERRGTVSVVRAYCWDLELNVSSEKIFEVPHEIGLKGNRKKILTDPRDIYELIANMGARRLRACILNIIPGDITEAAVKESKRTLARGPNNETIEDRIRKMVLTFTQVGVSQEMIEERLGHSVDLTTAEELVDLVGIYNAIRDGQSKRKDFFNFPEEEDSGGKAAEFRDALHQEDRDGEA